MVIHEQITRHTRQKDAVLQRLRTTEDFVSAQELHRQLADHGSTIGLATVYRRLNALAQVGVADTIRLNGQQMFRICEDHQHHHHLVCQRCGRTVEIDPPDEQWVHSVAQQYGYTMTSHMVEVFGLCPQCQRETRETDSDAGDSSEAVNE